MKASTRLKLGIALRSIQHQTSATGMSELAKKARESILTGHGDPNTTSGRNAQAALVAAESLLREGPSANLGHTRRESRDAAAKFQRSILREAARDITLPGGKDVADEGEHRVRHDEETGLAHKATNNERYGYILDQDEWAAHRKLNLRPALPSEYFWRIGLQNILFEDAIKVTGIAKVSFSHEFSIHTSQPWIDTAEPPPAISMDDIHQFMEGKGYVQLPGGMILSGVPRILAWYHRCDEVLVYDTKPGNFIKGEDDALYPVDLNIAIFTRDLMRDTAKHNHVVWPELDQ